MRPLVIHISADFPDAMVADKTAVVRRLLAATPQADHHVYSLNRLDGNGGIVMLPARDGVTALAYKAPAKGILLRTRLIEVARAIAHDLRLGSILTGGTRPILLHAHKLTVEGLVVEELSRDFGWPYLVTIQGDSDLKIMAARRDLRPRYRRILDGAAGVATLAPWSRTAVAQVLGFPAERIVLLPCLTDVDEMTAAPVVGRPHFVTTFHLSSARRKNLDGLAAAAVLAARELPDLRIDVVGGGRPADVFAAQGMIERAGAGAVMQLTGPLPRADMQARLPQYAALVLPTRRESYGLVHIEALFAGLPVMWSRDRGVDGLFDAATAGCRCDPDDIADIARGLKLLSSNEQALKLGIARLQSDGAFDHLRRRAIADRYAAMLNSALARGTPP